MAGELLRGSRNFCRDFDRGQVVEPMQRAMRRAVVRLYERGALSRQQLDRYHISVTEDEVRHCVLAGAEAEASRIAALHIFIACAPNNGQPPFYRYLCFFVLGAHDNRWHCAGSSPSRANLNSDQVRVVFSPVPAY